MAAVISLKIWNKLDHDSYMTLSFKVESLNFLPCKIYKKKRNHYIKVKDMRSREREREVADFLQ